MKEYTVKIEGKKWEEALEKAFQKENAKAKIDGFRPGKAPKEVFIKKYGEQSLYFTAADSLVQDAYEEMIEANKDVQIVAQPEMRVNKIDKDGVEFVFTLTLKPEVKLGKYKGLKVKKEKVTVTKKEIEETIEHMKSHYAEEVTKADGSTVSEGDTAIIDFEGFKDGVAFPGGKGENYALQIGSHTFIPGFEEQIIGMKVGEEKEIKVTFPEDYQAEELKGQDAIFKVKVNEIKETIIPELNDEFFEDLGMEGIHDKASLEKQVEENIKARKEADAENKYMDELLVEAGKNTKVEIPEIMEKEETDRMLNQYEEQLKLQGLSLAQFYQFTNSDEQALRDQMKEEAHNRVLYRLMLEAIAEKEKFEISDDDAEKEADHLATHYQMSKEDFLKAFGGLEMVKYDMKMRKAMETLKEEK